MKHSPSIKFPGIVRDPQRIPYKQNELVISTVYQRQAKTRVFWAARWPTIFLLINVPINQSNCANPHYGMSTHTHTHTKIGVRHAFINNGGRSFGWSASLRATSEKLMFCCSETAENSPGKSVRHRWKEVVFIELPIWKEGGRWSGNTGEKLMKS